MKSVAWLHKIFQKKKVQTTYLALLIVLIPLVIGFNTLIVLDDFQKTLDIELQRKAFLTTEMIDLLGDIEIKDQTKLQNLINDISVIGSEFIAIDIFIPSRDKFKVVASLNKQAINKETSQTQFVLAWQRETAIAHKTRSSSTTTAELASLPPRISPSDFWVVTKPIYNQAKEKIALLSVKLSSKVTDTLVNRILLKSYILLALTVILTLVIIMGIIQVFKSMTFFRKKVAELDELKSTFIEVVSHQLRTPLNSIKWNLELLLNEDLGKLNPEMKNFIHATHKSNQNIIHTVQDLILSLDIERQKLQINKETAVSIPHLIKTVLLEQQSAIDLKSLKIIYVKPTRFPKLTLDSKLTQQAIYKIIDNAIRYTKDNGKITIKLKKEKNKVLLSIEDTGVGIPKDEQNKLFTKFFRARNASTMYQDASGLGLFVAQNIITAHKGNIIFTSKEGKGSKFTIILPLK